MPHFNNISIKWQKSVLLVKKLEYQEKNTDMMSQVIKLITYIYRHPVLGGHVRGYIFNQPIVTPITVLLDASVKKKNKTRGSPEPVLLI
jgi:hypothetical protein